MCCVHSLAVEAQGGGLLNCADMQCGPQWELWKGTAPLPGCLASRNSCKAAHGAVTVPVLPLPARPAAPGFPLSPTDCYNKNVTLKSGRCSARCAASVQPNCFCSA